MGRPVAFDRSGLLLALGDAQQQIARGVLALGARDLNRAEAHMRNAQRALLPAVAVAQSDPDDGDHHD